MRRSEAQVRLLWAGCAVLGTLPALTGCALTADRGDSATSLDADLVSPSTTVDILIVVDNQHGNDANNGRLLTEETLERVIRHLIAGDRDDDGVQDFSPATSVHVGVVTGDMGVGGVPDAGPGCGSGFGDDGVLRNTDLHVDPSGPCPQSFPSGIFDFEPVADVDGLVFDLNCTISVQTSGCSVEQMLEAPLKALSPAPNLDGSSPVPWTRPNYVPPTFIADTVGHGSPDGLNAGFLRPDSVLVIFVDTPDDDCSTPNPSIFSLSDPRYADTPIGLRCHMTPEERYPVARYVDGLLGLRRYSSRLVFGALIGIPEGSERLDYESILSDPAMTESVDPAAAGQLLVACSSAWGPAEPARRIVSVARDLDAAGAHVALHSYCDGVTRDFATHVLDEIVASMQGI